VGLTCMHMHILYIEMLNYPPFFFLLWSMVLDLDRTGEAEQVAAWGFRICPQFSAC